MDDPLRPHADIGKSSREQKDTKVNKEFQLSRVHYNICVLLAIFCVWLIIFAITSRGVKGSDVVSVPGTLMLFSAVVAFLSIFRARSLGLRGLWAKGLFAVHVVASIIFFTPLFPIIGMVLFAVALLPLVVTVVVYTISSANDSPDAMFDRGSIFGAFVGLLVVASFGVIIFTYFFAFGKM